MQHTSSMIPPVRPGTQAITRAIFPYPLPSGLGSGAQVTVETVMDGICVVRDQHGRSWELPVLTLDTGRLVWHDGRWVPERNSAAA